MRVVSLDVGPMRIVYVLTSLGVGGAEKQVIGLADRMADRGHQVLLLVLKEQAREEWRHVLHHQNRQR